MALFSGARCYHRDQGRARYTPGAVGYFKRKLSRARARNEVRDFTADPEVAGHPWEPIADSPPTASRFVRFAAHATHPSSSKREGIFTAAYVVLRGPELDPVVAKQLRTELDWFNAELIGPDIDDERAVFFFKSSARECMQHVWALLHALRAAGVWAEMQTYASPGRVVYEDAHQVAAVPWADSGVR